MGCDNTSALLRGLHKVLAYSGMCSAALIYIAVLAEPTKAETWSGIASVIDGDTLDIHGVRIRLEGIDAPEASQLCYDERQTAWRCGQVAARALDEFIIRKTVHCETHSKDRYGRYIATCYFGGTDLSAALVSSGLAVAYRKYSNRYVLEEENARAANVGIWRGAFVMPWDWRRGERIDE
jgi:endonuclease YncB( thermonuclease family)